MGDKPRRTWKEAAVRWGKEKSHKKDFDKDLAKLRWLDPHLGHLRLDEIDDDTIDEIVELKQDEPGKNGELVKNATVNRYLALIRAILRRAALKWRWLEHPPMIELLPEDNERVRWLTEPEADSLIDALPDYYALPARFALATGLRQSNVLQLSWSQVDLKRQCAWIHAKQTKAGSAIAVPLNAEAMAVLKACQGAHHERVFVKKGQPFDKIESRLWKAALEKAGISDFRWHDLRHTWASWHVMAGTPLHELMELGGWKTYKMVLRYSHLSADHLQKAADRIGKPRVAAPTPPPRGRPQLRVVK